MRLRLSSLLHSPDRYGLLLSLADGLGFPSARTARIDSPGSVRAAFRKECDMPRSFSLAAIVILLGSLAFASHGSSPSPGLAIGHGEVIESPYVWTGIGTPTLYLNGKVYLEIRGTEPQTTSVTTDQVSWSRLVHNDAFYAYVQPALRANKREAFYQTIEQSGQIVPGSLRRVENGCWVQRLMDESIRQRTGHSCEMFIGFPTDGMTEPIVYTPPTETDFRRIHEETIAEFDTVMECGGVVAFGSNNNIVTGNVVAKARTLEAMELLRDRSSVDREELDGSVFMNTGIFTDRYPNVELIREEQKVR
jgi:hypothetical protein